MKTIDDGVQSWFSTLLTFLPDVRCFIRLSYNNRITIIVLCREFHSMGGRDASVVTMVVCGVLLQQVVR